MAVAAAMAAASSKVVMVTRGSPEGGLGEREDDGLRLRDGRGVGEVVLRRRERSSAAMAAGEMAVGVRWRVRRRVVTPLLAWMTFDGVGGGKGPESCSLLSVVAVAAGVSERRPSWAGVVAAAVVDSASTTVAATAAALVKVAVASRGVCGGGERLRLREGWSGGDAARWCLRSLVLRAA